MGTPIITHDDTAVSWYAMSAAGKIPYTLAMLRQRNIFCWAPFHNHPAADSSLMPLILFRATELQVYSLHADRMCPGFIYAKLGADRWIPSPLAELEVRRFRTIRELDNGKYRYFADSKKIMQKGKPVRVTDGLFKGMEGYICRIKGNTSLYINIPRICVVSLAYIPKAFLEGFDELKEKQERQDTEAALKEQTALQLSDEYNRNHFAAYSPAEYLRIFQPSQHARQDILDCITRLREECCRNGIDIKELYLLSDPEEWSEAIQTHIQN